MNGMYHVAVSNPDGEVELEFAATEKQLDKWFSQYSMMAHLWDGNKITIAPISKEEAVKLPKY